MIRRYIQFNGKGFNTIRTNGKSWYIGKRVPGMFFPSAHLKAPRSLSLTLLASMATRTSAALWRWAWISRMEPNQESK